MTFVFCGFVFDSSDEKAKQMPVASEDWVPHPGAKITSSITTVKGATIQSTTTAWMSPYSRTAPPDRGGSHNNNNNNNNGVVILDGCRPPAATTARRFFRWFSRLGQPPIGKTGECNDQLQSGYRLPYARVCEITMSSFEKRAYLHVCICMRDKYLNFISRFIPPYFTRCIRFLGYFLES